MVHLSVRKCECGVGPAKGVEDAARDSLDVAGDGVADQLDGGDDEAAGQEDAHGDLVVEAEHKCVR